VVLVAVRVTPWKVLSTGSTLPKDDTSTHFCHHHTKRALLSLLVVCDKYSEAFGLRSITSAVRISGYSYEAIIRLFRFDRDKPPEEGDGEVASRGWIPLC
jgi:hypothetical protein